MLLSSRKIFTNRYLSLNYLGYRGFHYTKPLNGDPISSTALIVGNYAMMSPAYVLILAFAGYIVLNGTIIYDLINTSQSDAQFALMFPEDGPADMFFIADNDLRLIFQYLRNIINGGGFWSNHIDFIDQLNWEQLRPLAENLTFAVETLQDFDDMLDSILELDNPMYNVSYEMIVRIRREELYYAINYIDNIKTYVITRFMLLN